MATLAGLYQDLYKEFFGEKGAEGEDRNVCSDAYLSLELKSDFAGPFYNSDNYDFEAVITNHREVLLYVAAVQANFLSQRVIEEVDSIRELQRGGDPLYYVSIFEGPGVILPGEERLLHFRGPQFAPEEVIFEIKHSGAKSGSVCHFPILAAVGADLPSPRDLYLDTDLGMDGLNALRRAANLVEDVAQSPCLLVSCMPSSHTTYIQPTGLYLQKVTEWIVIFKVQGQLKFVMVDDEEARMAGSKQADDEDSPAFNMERVRIGSGDALRIAMESNILYDNSSLGWFLAAVVRADGTATPVWRLPYIGPGYLNILVDAESGAVLNSKEFYRQLVPLETGSRTRERRKDDSAKEEPPG